MPGKDASDAYGANSFKINFKSEKMNQRSPILALHGLGQNCFVRDVPNNIWQSRNSLEQLQASGVNSYYSAGGDLYLRLISSEVSESTDYPSEYAKQGRSKYALINCQ